MAKRRTRNCYTCLKEYQYCPNCAIDYNKPRWMFSFCCEECKDVYQIISGYNTKDSGITQKNVQDVLKKYNVKDITKYTDDIQNELKKIISVKKTNKKPETSEEV